MMSSRDIRKIEGTNFVIEAGWTKEETPQLIDARLKSTKHWLESIIIPSEDLLLVKTALESLILDAEMQKKAKARKEVSECE